MSMSSNPVLLSLMVPLKEILDRLVQELFYVLKLGEWYASLELYAMILGYESFFI